jgi:hypothetical protein
MGVRVLRKDEAEKESIRAVILKHFLCQGLRIYEEAGEVAACAHHASRLRLNAYHRTVSHRRREMKRDSSIFQVQVLTDNVIVLLIPVISR